MLFYTSIYSFTRILDQMWNKQMLKTQFCSAVLVIMTQTGKKLVIHVYVIECEISKKKTKQQSRFYLSFQVLIPLKQKNRIPEIIFFFLKSLLKFILPGI